MLPSEKFHCLLDEMPLHLVPCRAPDRKWFAGEFSQPLIFNPDVSVLPAGEMPEEFETRRELLDGFYLEGPIAWVRDPAVGFLQPFWLGPRLEALVGRLQEGALAPSSLSGESKRLLAGAQILIPEGYKECRRRDWAESLFTAASDFKEKDYTPLESLIHPFHVAALRRYYRHQIRCGQIWLGDEQSSLRYVAHNESVARFFHQQIATTVSAVAGEPVKPSYVYMASYVSGAELKKHRDREQCEFSVTLCLDFSPEPELATPWPVRLDTSAGMVSVYQALGDGLVYRGTKLPHYRDVLPEGNTSTSIFFHYVAANFSGPLD